MARKLPSVKRKVKESKAPAAASGDAPVLEVSGTRSLDSLQLATRTHPAAARYAQVVAKMATLKAEGESFVVDPKQIGTDTKKLADRITSFLNSQKAVTAPKGLRFRRFVLKDGGIAIALVKAKS